MSSNGIEAYKKNIGLVGSVSLLVSAITGPGLIAVPGTFQSAGWLPSFAVFTLISALSCLGALFLTEAISKYPGNAAFQRNVELTTLVQHFYGPTYHMLTQLGLYASLQTVNIASIVISTQAIDRFWVNLAGATCGFEMGVSNGGWRCVNQAMASEGTSPFLGNGTPGTMILFTLGFVALIFLVVPLATMDLNDNTVIQFISFLVLLGIVGFWFSTFVSEPLTSSLVPALGPSAGALVGTVLSNYAFVTAVPSWLGVKHPRVSVHKAVLISLSISLVLYLSIGVVGGMWHPISSESDLLAEIDNQVVNIVFPLFTLVTSIPVNIIIIRANLVQAKVCGRGWAMFWAALFPFLVCIPLQTSDSLNTFFSWASLITSSLANFITPFLIYIFLKNRKSDDLIMNLHPEMSRHTLNTEDTSDGSMDELGISVEMLEEDAKLMTVKVDLAEITATLKDAAASRSGSKKGITSSSKGDSTLGSRLIGSKFSVGGRRNSVLAGVMANQPSGGGNSIMGNMLARAASRNLSDKGGSRRKSYIDLQMAADLGLSQGNLASSSFESSFRDTPSITVTAPPPTTQISGSSNPAPSSSVVSQSTSDWKPLPPKTDSDSDKSTSSFPRGSALETIMSNTDLEEESDEDADTEESEPAGIPATKPAPAASTTCPSSSDAPNSKVAEVIRSGTFRMPGSMKRMVGKGAPAPVEDKPAETATTSSAVSAPAKKEPDTPPPLTERDLLPPGIGSLSDLGKPAITLLLTPFDADEPTDQQVGLDGKIRKTPVVPKSPTTVDPAPKITIESLATGSKSLNSTKIGKQKILGPASPKTGAAEEPAKEQPAAKEPATKALAFEVANPYGEQSAVKKVAPAKPTTGTTVSPASKPPLVPAKDAAGKVKAAPAEQELPVLPAKGSSGADKPVATATPSAGTEKTDSSGATSNGTSQPPAAKPSRERRSSLERRMSLEQRRSSIPTAGENGQRSTSGRTGSPPTSGTSSVPSPTNTGDIRATGIARRNSKDAAQMNASSGMTDLSGFESSWSSPSSSRPGTAQYFSPTSATALLPHPETQPEAPAPPPPKPTKVPSVAGFYLDPYYKNRLKELQQANPDYPRPDLDGIDALDQVLPEGLKAFQAIPPGLLVIRLYSPVWYWNWFVGLFSCFACCLRLRRGKRVGAMASGALLPDNTGSGDAWTGSGSVWRSDDRGQGSVVEIQPHWVALVALIITGCTTAGAIIANIVIAATQ